MVYSPSANTVLRKVHMDPLTFIEDFRDIIIIVFGITALVALTVLLIFTVLIGFAVLGLIKATRSTLRDGVGPLMNDAQETARGVKGTTEFVSDSMVRPIIRVYGVYAGLRRGLGVLGRARPKRPRS